MKVDTLDGREFLQVDIQGTRGFQVKAGIQGFRVIPPVVIQGFSSRSGFSGYSGFSGNSTSGYSGFCGQSGYSGFSGKSGTRGLVDVPDTRDSVRTPVLRDIRI
jgi:hypothetical protein